jgi:hypothetical protein
VRTSSLALVFLQNIYCLEVQFCVYMCKGTVFGRLRLHSLTISNVECLGSLKGHFGMFGIQG